MARKYVHRTGADLRTGDLGASLRHRTPEERMAAQAAAQQVADDMADLQETAALNRTIRGLMAVLRSCSTPQSRAIVEARVRPLVEQRRAIEQRRR